MSRIGKLPISIPAGVTVSQNGGVVTVKGPKGELSQKIDSSIINKYLTHCRMLRHFCAILCALFQVMRFVHQLVVTVLLSS